MAPVDAHAILGAVVSPPAWIEMPAVIAGALAGALFAQRRGLDIVGILALAIVSGLGGGIIRDVLLARIPVTLQDPKYLWAVAGAAVVGGFFAAGVNRLRYALVSMDALSLGLFSVVGGQGALNAGLPRPSAILLGTITGVGGGVIRDILVGDVPPRILRRGAPYASAAFLGTSLYVVLVDVADVRKPVAQVAAVVLVCLIRGVSTWRRWETPAARDITPRFLIRDETLPRDPDDPAPPMRSDAPGGADDHPR